MGNTASKDSGEGAPSMEASQRGKYQREATTYDSLKPDFVPPYRSSLCSRRESNSSSHHRKGHMAPDRREYCGDNLSREARLYHDKWNTEEEGMSIPANFIPWTEHTTNDGRKYCYNFLTGETTWGELKPCKPEQRLPHEYAFHAHARGYTGSPWFVPAVWNEYTAPNGRTYFYNSATGDSYWDERKPIARFRCPPPSSYPNVPPRFSKTIADETFAIYENKSTPRLYVPLASPRMCTCELASTSNSPSSETARGNSRNYSTGDDLISPFPLQA
ncbi:Aste57867_10852 [Aphanomyces stellatus]|uniref:Aste57867_10852 protein n=1 Tax=Aphanomyces stellatus TaxID=120398 RepID=A0A485KRJ9_9STRA|nr:hypothetical protein As57867_010812 [Aphanomyces stellatus]VFT87720.1 Aste57867_10852 [Aphanomyces stellatus]